MDPKTLLKITYGMYIVSSKKGSRINGQISNTVFQVTSDPAQMSVCINKKNFTHECISASKTFCACVLSTEATFEFIGRFGFKNGREVNKFENIKYIIGENGCPVVRDNCIAYFEADVVSSCDVGTHTIFIGKVTDTVNLSEKDPMTYDYYRKVLKGVSPKTAPTYVRP